MSNTEADGPIHSLVLVSMLLMSDTNQEHSWSLWGEQLGLQAGVRRLERARKGNWPGFSLCLRVGQGEESHMAEACMSWHGLDYPSTPGRECPVFLITLGTHTRDRRGREEWFVKVVSIRSLKTGVSLYRYSPWCLMTEMWHDLFHCIWTYINHKFTMKPEARMGGDSSVEPSLDHCVGAQRVHCCYLTVLRME